MQIHISTELAYTSEKSGDGGEGFNMFALGLFESTGIAVNPSDMRAMTEAELNQRYIANLDAMRPAQFGYAHSLAAMNWQPYRAPEKPLDERFADFKVRLATALANRITT